MGDELGDEWWKLSNDSGASEDEQQKETVENLPEEKKAKKRGTQSKTMKQNKAKRKRTAQEVLEDERKEPKPKRRRKKKTITDVLATSEPKAGTPADLQKLVQDYYFDKRSVIELEDLQLPDSCFLASNDLTHSLSSYLKEICPKWAKVQRLHTEKRSLVLLIICSSALRTIDLIKQLTAYKGEAKVIKLFAKHIKVEEQVKLLDKSLTHIGVGTPGRVRALIEREGLGLQALRFLVLDWNWRDQKQRRMVDIPEVKSDLLKLMEAGLTKGCQEGGIKLGLF